MKKRDGGKRTVFTALVLLLLVIAAAWTLKTKDQKKEMETAKAEVSEEEKTLPQPPQEEPVEKPAEEPAEEPAEAPAEEELTEEDKSSDILAMEEELRAETERITFLPDYGSYPLLNTTPIRYLTMEVGATDQEVQFNWMSPSGQAGKITWYTVQNGDFFTYDAECTASSTMPGYYVNKVTVPNIQSGYSYVYRVGNDAGGWSPEYRYDVPEDDGKSLTFLVTSDAQIGEIEGDNPYEEGMYENIQEIIDSWDAVVTRVTNYVPEAEFLFHLGDQVNSYGSAEHYDGFLNHLGLYGIPLAPVVGNHDVPDEESLKKLGYPALPYFYEHFNVPNRSEEFGMSSYDKDGDYHFVRDDVLFIVLNSMTSQPIDTHEPYVAQVVEQYPDTKWRVLVQHYPAYTGVDGYQGMDEWIQKSLAYMVVDNDIDLVLTGHDHMYSRSVFTDRRCEPLAGYDCSTGAMAVNPEGGMYVTCSTSSGFAYKMNKASEPRLAVHGQPEAPTAIRIDITENELHLTTYLVDSWTVYDEYTIRKE